MNDDTIDMNMTVTETRKLRDFLNSLGEDRGFTFFLTPTFVESSIAPGAMTIRMELVDISNNQLIDITEY